MGRTPSLWAAALADTIDERYEVSGAASISGAGMLAVPHGNQVSEQPLSKIDGVSFLPMRENAEKSDLFAFIRRDNGTRGFSIKYMGTFSNNDQAIEETRQLLENAGVGVSVATGAG